MHSKHPFCYYRLGLCLKAILEDSGSQHGPNYAEGSNAAGTGVAVHMIIANTAIFTRFSSAIVDVDIAMAASEAIEAAAVVVTKTVVTNTVHARIDGALIDVCFAIPSCKACEKKEEKIY